VDVLRGAKRRQAAWSGVCAEGEKTVSLNIYESKLRGVAQSEEVAKRDTKQVREV